MVQPASLKVLVALGRWVLLQQPIAVAQSSENAHRVEVDGSLCRWLVARAPGLQKLVLDLYRDPFMGDRRPAAALHDSVATTLVAVLLALLEDTRVVMHLILPGMMQGCACPME